MRQLAGAVGAEVEVDDEVARRHRQRAVEHRRLDELVALATLVGRRHRLGGRRGARAAPMDDRLVGALGPLPAPVAIHGVVAAADRRDVRPSVEPRLERRQQPLRRARRRVAPVGEGMEGDAFRREPRPCASSAMATMCSSTAWMPPGPTRPIRCSRLPRSSAGWHASRRPRCRRSCRRRWPR